MAINGIQITYNGTTTKAISNADVEFQPDDRQELVKIIGGVTVEDYGVVADGEIISFNATFSASDYSVIAGYWSNRTKVTVTMPDGSTISNARLVIRRVTYADKLHPNYRSVQMEVWRT